MFTDTFAVAFAEQILGAFYFLIVGYFAWMLHHDPLAELQGVASFLFFVMFFSQSETNDMNTLVVHDFAQNRSFYPCFGK